MDSMDPGAVIKGELIFATRDDKLLYDVFD